MKETIEQKIKSTIEIFIKYDEENKEQILEKGKTLRDILKNSLDAETEVKAIYLQDYTEKSDYKIVVPNKIVNENKKIFYLNEKDIISDGQINEGILKEIETYLNNNYKIKNQFP